MSSDAQPAAVPAQPTKQQLNKERLASIQSYSFMFMFLFIFASFCSSVNVCLFAYRLDTASKYSNDNKKMVGTVKVLAEASLMAYAGVMVILIMFLNFGSAYALRNLSILVIILTIGLSFCDWAILGYCKNVQDIRNLRKEIGAEGRNPVSWSLLIKGLSLFFILVFLFFNRKAGTQVASSLNKAVNSARAGLGKLGVN